MTATRSGREWPPPDAESRSPGAAETATGAVSRKPAPSKIIEPTAAPQVAERAAGTLTRPMSKPAWDNSPGRAQRAWDNPAEQAREYHKARGNRPLIVEIEPERTFMIGNSRRSDINPAVRAGLRAVYIPHPHTWVLEQEPLDCPPDRVIELGSFSRLLDVF